MQVLPLAYRSYYADRNGIHFVVWRMWFGRCFSVTDVILDPFSNRDNPSVARLMEYLLGCDNCPNRETCSESKFDSLDVEEGQEGANE